MPCVYMATNLINGKRYIGVCKGYLSQRKSRHRYAAVVQGVPTIFGKAIRKYGYDLFRFRPLLATQDYEEALSEEARLVATLKPEYNLVAGGGGSFGWKHRPESIAKMSVAQSGRPGYWTGKKLPAHVVALKSEWSKTPERRLKWDMWRREGPVSVRKEIVCLNDGKHHTHAAAAADYYGISKGVIRSVAARGRHKAAAGLVFRYRGDHEGGLAEAIQVLDAVYANRARTAAIARRVAHVR